MVPSQTILWFISNLGKRVAGTRSSQVQCGEGECLKTRKSNLVTIFFFFSFSKDCPQISWPHSPLNPPRAQGDRGGWEGGLQGGCWEPARPLTVLSMLDFSPQPLTPNFYLTQFQVQILRLLRILGRNHEESSETMNDLLAQVGVGAWVMGVAL